MAEIPSHCAVAIVGAGPTGLAAALSLQKRGIKAVVLEANQLSPQGSRATVVHSRTLEVFEGLDIVEKIHKHSLINQHFQIASGSGILVDLDFSTLNAKYNHVAIISQRDTELLLEHELQIPVHRGVHVSSVTNEGTHTTLQLTLPSGTTQTLHAQYTIAADGLHSPIRHSLSIPFTGGKYALVLLTAELQLNLPPTTRTLSHTTIKIFLHPSGLTLFVPQPSGLWRIYCSFDTNALDENEQGSRELYQRVIDERVGQGRVEIEKLEWSARFHTHHRLAERYRKGRVFLAGDAAHVHSPAGGQGMNVGVQDGVRLGEILAEVVGMGKEGRGDVEEVLGRYERERRPVAEGVVAMTHGMTMGVTVKNRVLVWVRNLVMKILGRTVWLKGIFLRRLAQYPQMPREGQTRS